MFYQVERASGVTSSGFARSYHAGTMTSQKMAVHHSRLLEKNPLLARSPLMPPVPEWEFSRQTLAVEERRIAAGLVQRQGQCFTYHDANRVLVAEKKPEKQ